MDIINLSEDSDRLTVGKLQWAMGVIMDKVNLAEENGREVSLETKKAIDIFEKFVRDSGVTLYWP